MNSYSRRWVEGVQYQGVDEKIPYNLDTSNQPGTTRTSLQVKAYQYTPPNTYTDVTSTIISGTPAASGTDIGFVVHALTAGVLYRIETKWTNEDGGVFEAWGEIQAER